MGSIIFSTERFWEGLSEGVGIKSGLALGREELTSLLEGTPYEQMRLLDSSERLIRLHSTEYEEIFEHLLFKLGRLEQPTNQMPQIALYHRYKDQPEKLAVVVGVVEEFNGFLQREIERPTQPASGINPEPFMRTVARRFGKNGLDLALAMLEGFNVQLYKSPWAELRDRPWENSIDLRALFQSEGLLTQYGPFVDQRYIDFLHRNFDRIDEVNWRKFEGLTAEFFYREGYDVELGAGRNDGNIDVRVWPSGERASSAPLILVQCKRQKQAVGKVVVKALYADVLDEGAKSGLVVTTSSVAPGAKEVRNARSYPIREAERDTLRGWLSAMRKPGLGVT